MKEKIKESAAPKVLEGTWPGNWTVILRFPSMAIAESWYGSEEYQPAVRIVAGTMR